MLLEDIHAAPHSQPATDGGWKSVCPIVESSHTQSSLCTPWPVARSAPATRTTGDLTMSGADSERYSDGCERIARTTGLIRSPERRYSAPRLRTLAPRGGSATEEGHNLVTRDGACLGRATAGANPAPVAKR